MASVPRSRLYYFVEQGMHFRVTFTLRASHMERWIHRVQQEFLNWAPENSICVGLDFEYTKTVKNVKKKNFPLEKMQHAAVLQLSMASETLVFQICHVDAVLELLREFLNNDAIMFWGATIQSDVQMLEYYGIAIPEVRDLQRNPQPNLQLSSGSLCSSECIYWDQSF
jgi:hypothetical protein